MTKSRRIRALLAACAAGAPLLAGVGAGCSGEKLVIGGDDLAEGGGSAASGGGGAEGRDAAAGTAGAAATGNGPGTGGAGGSGAAAGSSGSAGSGGSGLPVKCALPLDNDGVCTALIPRWWFNQQSGRCEMFRYNGCGGNANNFQTLEECTLTCSREICALPLDNDGTCDALIPSWWFNQQSGRCEFFHYNGCDGNANRFTSLEECSGTCAPGTGPACGFKRCSLGQTCCNPTCGICTAPGEGCTTAECDPCPGQDAHAEGDCFNGLGYKWDGRNCVPLFGCSCVGADCGNLTSQSDCIDSHRGCNEARCPEERRAMLELIEAHKSCSSTADCHTKSVGCGGITEDGCTGAVYVNGPDPGTFNAVRTELSECLGGYGCGSCLLPISPPACVAGRCVRGTRDGADGG